MLAYDTMHRVTQNQAKGLLALGYQVAIYGATHPYPSSVVGANILDAEAVGLHCGIYAVPSSNDTGVSWVDRAVSLVPSDARDRLLFLALDCETDAAANIEKINGALERLSQLGLPPLIYTAHWWWVGRFGNPVHTISSYLWNAFYDGDPDVDYASRPYGNWGPDKLMLEQFRGTHVAAGATIDANWVRDEFIERRLREIMPEETIDETARTRIEALRSLTTASSIFAGAAAKVLRGEPLTDAEKRALVYLVTGR